MRLLVLTIALVSCGYTHAQELSVESQGLQSSPAEVVTLISANQEIYEKSEFSRCTLVEKPFVADKIWVVTVKGCPIGNNAGPMWILLREGGRTRIVHEQNYFSIQVVNGSSHSLPNLIWNSSTAAFYMGGLLQYDGQCYKSSKTRIVDLNDPAACRANQDICKP
jgi:hypothetical protein